MPVIESKLNPRSEDFRANTAAMEAIVADLKAKVAKLAEGGGAKAREKHLSRGKLLPRDRVNELLDPGTPFLEFSQLAAYGMYNDDAPGAGVITGIGRIAGVECVIVCNDATVKGGTYYPVTVKSMCARKRLRRKTACLAFIWSIPAARICPTKMKCFQIVTTSAGSSSIRPICPPTAFRRSR